MSRSICIKCTICIDICIGRLIIILISMLLLYIAININIYISKYCTLFYSCVEHPVAGNPGYSLDPIG